MASLLKKLLFKYIFIAKARKEIIMSKVSIVYWSGTGNTATMAYYIAEGDKEAGADAAEELKSLGRILAGLI